MAHQAHWFYVLYSLKDGKLYKGTCADIGFRFLTHFMGGIHRFSLFTLLFSFK